MHTNTNRQCHSYGVRTNKHSIQLLVYTYSIVYVYIDIIAHTSTNEFGHIHTNPQHQECYVDEMLWG